MTVTIDGTEIGAIGRQTISKPEALFDSYEWARGWAITLWIRSSQVETVYAMREPSLTHLMCSMHP